MRGGADGRRAGLGRAEKRSGAPRSMSGCEALRDVAEGCVGGCLAEGWWRRPGSGTSLNGGAADEPPAGGRVRAEGWTAPFA